MPLLLLKSVLSLALIVLTASAMISMFEIFGRAEKRYDIERLKKIHRANGILYLLLFLIITYFCLRILLATKMELSPRSSWHSVFAFSILILLGLKVLFVRVYRQYYNQAKIIGLVIALMSFVMVWTSGGYYLLVTEFGKYKSIDRIMEYKMRGPAPLTERRDERGRMAVKTDPGSIGRGKNLFDTKCAFCHDPYSTRTIVGPGLKGVLKNPNLPVSSLPATPENVRFQLRRPLERMPSFDYLPEGEVEDIIAFLNTL